MAAMTYESIVAAVRKKLSKADVSSIPGTLAFQVDVEGKAEGIFYIEIKDGKLDPVLAFTTGKLKVDGDTNAAMELIRFLK